MHGAVEHHHISQQREERPNRDRALNDARAADQQEQEDADQKNEGERRPVVGPDLDDAEALGEPVLVGRVEFLHLVPLARKGLHHLDAGQTLLHRRGKLAHLFLNQFKARPHDHAEADGQRQQQGQRNEGEQGEAEALQHHGDDYTPSSSSVATRSVSPMPAKRSVSVMSLVARLIMSPVWARS